MRRAAIDFVADPAPVSADGGATWERRGRIEGGPYKVRAMGAERAFVALSDGSIVETRDAGRTFTTRFRP